MVRKVGAMQLAKKISGPPVALLPATCVGIGMAARKEGSKGNEK